jgi:hypothetical protein
VFLGSTPIGAPLVGWLAEVAGPRSGLFAGAAAALAAAVYARWAFARADGAGAARLPDREPQPCRSAPPRPAHASPLGRSRSGRRPRDEAVR